MNGYLYSPGCVFDWKALTFERTTGEILQAGSGPGEGFTPVFSSREECQKAYPQYPVMAWEIRMEPTPELPEA